MGNPFFKHHVDSKDPEYNLYRGMCNEVAEMYGIDFVFLQRKLENPDDIFGEDGSNKFDESRILTMYIENFQQFEGNGDLFGKFGFTIDDQLILVVGTDIFKNAVGADRPFEADLLYPPGSRKFFKVEHVSRPQGFYQFGAGEMMFRITTTLFKYSHERFESADGMIEGVDEFFDDLDNTDGPAEGDQFEKEASKILDFDQENIFGDKNTVDNSPVDIWSDRKLAVQASIVTSIISPNLLIAEDLLAINAAGDNLKINAAGDVLKIGA